MLHKKIHNNINMGIPFKALKYQAIYDYKIKLG